MMIASRNPEKGSISFLSIPRDLFVENPVTSNRSRINLVFWSAYSQSENIDEATKTIATLLAEIT
jgi:anionic cell wall polymer biosynthesis LytR-Cps2A-Psr (LCP) family protein